MWSLSLPPQTPMGFSSTTSRIRRCDRATSSWRTTIQPLTTQQDGLAAALRQAQAAAAELPEHEAAFLRDNLIYQSAIMVQTCVWLEQVELAHEAIDPGTGRPVQRAPAQAEAALWGLRSWRRATAVANGKTGIAAADQSSRDVHGSLPVDLFDQRMAHLAAETIVERTL